MGETMSVTPYTIFCAANSQFAIGVKDRIVNSPVILCDTKSNKEERYQWLIREDNTIALRVDPTLILDAAKLADYQTFYLSVYNSQKILDTQKWVYDGVKHFRNEGNPNFVIDNQGRAPASVHIRVWLDFARHGPVVTQWTTWGGPPGRLARSSCA